MFNAVEENETPLSANRNTRCKDRRQECISGAWVNRQDRHFIFQHGNHGFSTPKPFFPNVAATSKDASHQMQL